MDRGPNFGQKKEVHFLLGPAISFSPFSIETRRKVWGKEGLGWGHGGEEERTMAKQTNDAPFSLLKFTGHKFCATPDSTVWAIASRGIGKKGQLGMQKGGRKWRRGWMGGWKDKFG